MGCRIAFRWGGWYVDSVRHRAPAANCSSRLGYSPTRNRFSGFGLKPKGATNCLGTPNGATSGPAEGHMRCDLAVPDVAVPVGYAGPGAQANLICAAAPAETPERLAPRSHRAIDHLVRHTVPQSRAGIASHSRGQQIHRWCRGVRRSMPYMANARRSPCASNARKRIFTGSAVSVMVYNRARQYQRGTLVGQFHSEKAADRAPHCPRTVPGFVPVLPTTAPPAV